MKSILNTNSKEFKKFTQINLTLKLLFLFSSLFLNVSESFSQPQANNWFFSRNSGLNFSSGTPVNILGGQITRIEGASAISDNNGQLLFYTDGYNVWNKNHAVMSNGQALAGGYGSCTQSSIIIPKINDGKKYYIFTADEEGYSRGLQYSIVDMTLNNGLGDVALKNSPLVTYTAEKVTAIRHCNKKDYWVLTHKYGTNAYYAYRINEFGVDPNPVISLTGGTVPVRYGTMAGALKSSPDGKKIIALHLSYGVELSDFNNQTGIVSNTTEIFNNDNAAHYGAEFSLSSKKLYLSISGYWSPQDVRRYSSVFQYDLSLPSTQQIINSKFEVFRFQDQLAELGSLQRGPDGKIYMSQFKKNYLSVINSPEIYGAGCNFVELGHILAGQGNFSLPNLLNDYGTAIDSFRVISSSFCTGSPISFDYNPVGNVTGLLWDFADPSSGIQNNSTSQNPSHTFSTSGSYTIKLIKFSPCGNDTLRKQITIGELQVSIGNDTSICENTSYIINPQTSGVNSYLWQDGSTAASYNATSEGLIWVKVSNSLNGCSKSDSLFITTKAAPPINLGKDTSLCSGQILVLDAFVQGASLYKWQDNSTNSNLVINKGGLFWVEGTLNGCTKRDSINVNFLRKPQFSLGPDQFLCPGLSLKLAPGLMNVSLNWQDGNTNPFYEVKNPGLYYVDLANSCGVTRDSINIFSGNCIVSVPSTFTPNNDGLNDQFRILGTSLISELSFKIFNRYGELIFKTEDKNQSWNGFAKGVPSIPGVYVYLIEYKEIGGADKKYLKGTVMLIR